MRIIWLRVALPTAVLAIGFAAQARAQNTAAFSDRDFQAKLQYCKTCHGLSGQGFCGSSPMPRLAGQQPEYFENQLRAFIERRRENKFMYGVAHVLNPTMLPTLAAHFRDLNPKPLGGAPRDLVARGQTIYEQGIPDANVPPCRSCHGPDAKGSAVFPRLAGQLNDYIVRKLVNWDKERGQDPKNPDTSAIMAPVAHSLTDAQMAAVAAYLSYLE